MDSCNGWYEIVYGEGYAWICGSIERVYRIDLYSETLIDKERTFIHYAEETFGADASGLVNSRYGQELVAVYTQDDVQAYSEVRAERSRQQGSGGSENAGDRKVQRGRGRNRGAGEGSRLKFSVKDSTGRTLTKEQQKFFADSKVRDEDGNMIVM